MRKLLVVGLVASSALVSQAHAWGRSENIALGVAAITYMAVRQPEVRIQNYPVYPQSYPQAVPQIIPNNHQQYQRPVQCVQIPVRDDTPYQTGSIVTTVTRCY